MPKKNLMILLKFEKGDDIEPSEEHQFCSEHFEQKKEEYKDYQVIPVESSMPNVWCEICTPPEDLY